MKKLYLDIISGRRRGLFAKTMRGILSLTTIFYALGHTLRKLLYKIGILRSTKLPIPVISVGNLTAGGTGKTPMVESLSRWFSRRNLRCVVLARGYQPVPELGHDDEHLFAEMEIEGVVRLPGRDRVLQAKKALDDLRPDLFILDDGFQHYRIERDLEILVIDTTNPFAQHRLIPRGLLREGVRNARRADLLVLTRCDQTDPEELQQLRTRLDHITAGKPMVETIHKPVAVRLLSSRTRRGLHWLKGRSVFAICGIGNPDAFRRTLESIGADVVLFQAFEDHHRYSLRDIQQINAAAQEFMVDAIITTEKDALKLNPDTFDLPLCALTVEIDILRGRKLLESRLRECVEGGLRVANTAQTS